jgi:hypothetical protein
VPAVGIYKNKPIGQDTDATAEAAIMKRGFLFGLGSFFILGVIAMLTEASIASGQLRLASVIIALIFIPLSVKILRSANLTSPHLSRLHAIVGWLLGFLAIDAILLAAFAVVALSTPTWNPFAPKDYEECAESAAMTAKSKEALAILISTCNSRADSGRFYA